MNDKVVSVDKSDNYRIIAISDVHGHLEILKSLINKIELKDDDYLVILGDFINRGPDSLGCLIYMKELLLRPNTFVLKGNHEYFVHDSMLNKDISSKLLKFLQGDYYQTLIHDLANEVDFDLYNCDNVDDFHSIMISNFLDELNFIKNLPIIFEIDEFIFVHGGYDKSFDVRVDELKYLKYDDYLKKGSKSSKNVVVGHWPTSNLRDDVFTNSPLIDVDKKIISIDGGLGVKTAGELNAFIIEKNNSNISYRCVQENNFDRFKIKMNHEFEVEDKVLINYPHFDVDIIKHGEELSLCRHRYSNKKLSVLNSLLTKKDNHHIVNLIFINNFINLEVGEEVEFVLTVDEYVFVKYKDEFGWILKKQII
ncbi:metallophosphoesterase [Mycoplasmatota bacterium WC44]